MRIKLLYLFLLLLVSFFCTCFHQPNSGGTTDTGNAKIAGIIYDTHGKKAGGVKITACVSNYHSEISLENDSKKVINTITDDNGSFSLDISDTGEYWIEANDQKEVASLFKMKVKNLENITINIKDTLKPYAKINGNVGIESDTSIKRYVVVYGLERLVPVKEDGYFEIKDLPAGTFHLRIISLNKYWEPIDIENISLSAADSITIDLRDSLQVNSDSIYKIKIKIDSIRTYITKDIYNFPILIKLKEENFDFDLALEDGSDIRIFNKDTISPLPFEIELWDKNKKSAVLWVKIDTIYRNIDSQYFWLFYGNTDSLPRLQSGVFDTTDSFMAVYHFSGNLKDATQNGYNGIDSGTSELINSIIGKGRSFNGISQFFTIGNLPERTTGTISF